MRLVTKYNLINVFLGSLLLASGGCIFYSIFVRTMNEEVNEKLIDNKDRIVALIENRKPVQSIPPVMEVEKLGSNSVPSLDIHDTILLDPISEDRERFREVSSIEKIHEEFYRITTRQVILERHDYLENVGSGLLIIWLMINLGLMILTLLGAKKLWSPFRKNLERLKKFRVTDEAPIVFQKSSTKEFKELNSVMEALTEKVRMDYRSLREFSENAAHEIQTPLMIIQTKLEDALQYPGLSPEIGEKIQAALASCNRLSKLVQKILFIAKIENHQFDRKQPVDLAESIKTELVQLNDFIGTRKLHVTADLNPVVKMIDPLLAEVFVTNLLTNAIRHNIENGNIHIRINQERLTVYNPSDTVIEHPESMFDRFAKSSKISSSHGLGLAIVKKICDQQNWTVTYKMEGNIHLIEVVF